MAGPQPSDLTLAEELLLLAFDERNITVGVVAGAAASAGADGGGGNGGGNGGGG